MCRQGMPRAARHERVERGAARDQAPGASDPGQGDRRHRPPPHLQHRNRRRHGAVERAWPNFRRATPADRSVMHEALEIAVLCALAHHSARHPRAVAALWATSRALIDEPWLSGRCRGAANSRPLNIVVQVNGKLRAPHHGAGGCATRTACAPRRWPIPTCSKFIGTAAVRKVIVVPRQARQRRGVDARRASTTRRSWRRSRRRAGAGLCACGFRLAGSEPLPAVLARPYLSRQGSVHRFLARVRASAQKFRRAACRAIRQGSTATIEVTKDLVEQRTLAVSAAQHPDRL